MQNVGGVVLIWANKTICLYWTVTPIWVTWILPDLQTEHNSDKAGHDNAKSNYFYFNSIFEGGVAYWNLT